MHCVTCFIHVQEVFCHSDGDLQFQYMNSVKKSLHWHVFVNSCLKCKNCAFFIHLLKFVTTKQNVASGWITTLFGYLFCACLLPHIYVFVYAIWRFVIFWLNAHAIHTDEIHFPPQPDTTLISRRLGVHVPLFRLDPQCLTNNANRQMVSMCTYIYQHRNTLLNSQWAFPLVYLECRIANFSVLSAVPSYCFWWRRLMIHSAWLGFPRCWQGTKTNRREEVSA
jgi:hypothetical protein